MRNIAYNLIELTSEIVLLYDGNEISFSIRVRNELRFIINSECFNILDISGQIFYKMKLLLVQRLILEGIIMLLEPIT